MKRLLFIALLVVFACEDKQEKDCAGVEGGTATVDDCGLCTGGTTEHLPNYMKDCSGECFGEAVLDSCNICFGGNTGVTACGQDCAGEWGGNAEILTYWLDSDNDGLGSGDSSQFCNASVEEGWVLNGDDTDDNCTSNVHDCADVCDGDAVLDCAGVCDGTTQPEDCTVTDIDGNIYQNVQIGDQLWMQENLKVTHYNNGDEIPTGYSNSEWADLYETETGAYAVYDDNESNADVYGNLYNWYSVEDDRGICPEGWHIPTDGEYTALSDYLGGTDVAGGKMKECTERSCPESEYWNSPNTGATNESGFTGLPGGNRSRTDGSYGNMGFLGYFWSSTENNNNHAWNRVLHYTTSEPHPGYTYKKSGFSVRCIKD